MEFEVKFKVDDLDKIKKIISQLGGKYLKTLFQKDIYLKHPSRDFIKTDEVLRLRIENSKSIVTYKGPRLGGEVKAREEIEVCVDNAENFLKIMNRLGFEPALVIKKKREIYEINSVKVNLDNVEGIGKYIELEVVSSNKDEAIEKIKEVCSLLGLDYEKRLITTYFEELKSIKR